MTKQQKPPQQSTTSTASATVFTRQDSKLDNEEETTISTSVRSPPSPNNIYSESAISNPPYNLSTSVSGSKRRISSSAYSSSSAIPPHKPSSSKGKRTRPSGLISLIANAAWTERILWIAGIIAVGFGFHCEYFFLKDIIIFWASKILQTTL